MRKWNRNPIDTNGLRRVATSLAVGLAIAVPALAEAQALLPGDLVATEEGFFSNPDFIRGFDPDTWQPGTGVHSTFEYSLPTNGLAGDVEVDAGRRLIISDGEIEGGRILSVDPKNGQHSVLWVASAADDTPDDIEIESNGNILVEMTDGRLFRVDPNTGQESLLTTLPTASYWTRGIAVAPDGTIWAAMNLSATRQPLIIALDLQSGSTTFTTTFQCPDLSGFGHTCLGVRGGGPIAIGMDGSVYAVGAAWAIDIVEIAYLFLARIDPVSGVQTVLGIWGGEYGFDANTDFADMEVAANGDVFMLGGETNKVWRAESEALEDFYVDLDSLGTVVSLAAVRPRCNDRLDNDADGLVDHPLDPQCPTPSRDREGSICGLLGIELLLILPFVWRRRPRLTRALAH